MNKNSSTEIRPTILLNGMKYLLFQLASCNLAET